MARALVATMMLLALASAGSAAQSPDVEIERVAVRAMLERAPGGVIALNPLLVQEGTGPGVEGRARESRRNTTLSQALGAKVLPRHEVVLCAQRDCGIRGADVYVSLSEPRLAGDSAFVTVTIDSRGGRPGRLYYETVHFSLLKSDGSWKVVKAEQLGIS